MIQVNFKNLERSDLVKRAVEERMAPVLLKFPDLIRSRIFVTLSMENSPFQAGPDLFAVKWQSQGGRYRNLILQKSSPNIYQALAEVIEHLQERLNRFGDKMRMRRLREARKEKRQLRKVEGGIYEEGLE